MLSSVFAGMTWILVVWNISQPSFHQEGKSTAWCLRALHCHICQLSKCLLSASPAVAAPRATAARDMVKLLVHSYIRHCSWVKLSWLGCSSTSSMWISMLWEATRHQTLTQQPTNTEQGGSLGVSWEKHFVFHMDQWSELLPLPVFWTSVFLFKITVL